MDADKQLPLASPYLSFQTGLWYGAPPGSLAAVCVTGHSAPDGDCECGWRVLRSRSDLARAMLAEYRMRTCLPARSEHHWEPDVFDRVAIGSVAAWGRIMYAAGGDHAGVLRAQHVCVAGTIALPAAVGSAADRVRDVYGVEVTVGDGDGLAFVAGFLAQRRRSTCQACGQPVDPAVLPGLCADPFEEVCALRQRGRLRQGCRL